MIGLYDLIGTPFGYLMSWIYAVVNNYGAAIIIFTVVTKLLLLPVNYKTQKNSARMRLLNPKLEKLRKSYKDNPQRLQQEQQALYQQEGLNPMASCLPSVIQMILLFGVLDVVYKPLTHILHFTKKIIGSSVEIASKLTEDGISTSDLRSELRVMEQLSLAPDKFSSLADNFRDRVLEFNEHFTIFGANLGKTPTLSPETWNTESIILVLIPFLAGLSQLVFTVYSQMYQKKNNPAMQNMGCMNVMLYLMPLLSVWFAFNVPAGVGFYWIWSSLFSFLITFLLNVYFNNDRIAVINEKEKEKARIRAEKHPERKSFMQKMLEQQQALEQQQRGLNPDRTKMSRSEQNKANYDAVKEARKRMAQKYGDDYDED